MASSDPNANANANVPTPVPFPQPDFVQPQQQQQQPSQAEPATQSPTTPQRRSRTSTNASIASATSRIRTASLKLMDADPPAGMWAATGQTASKAPTMAEIRRGSFSSSGWNEESQRLKAERRASQGEEGGKWFPRRTSSTQSATPESPARPTVGKSVRTGSSGIQNTALGTEPFPAVTEEDTGGALVHDHTKAHTVLEEPKHEHFNNRDGGASEPKENSALIEKETNGEAAQLTNARQYSNGYVPPPKVPWTTSTVIGLKAFWKWFLTIPGFLITIYGLNVVAWGGMLFLLLCNAAPAMCVPDCNHIESPRRKWIEVDSQILNALFCVTGFGLAPWRMRDLYWWGHWRLGGSKRKETGVRRLAGIHRGWFRLPGSDALPPLADATTVNPEDPAVPIPHGKIPDPPPTGIHAPPTNGWKMDFVVWMNMWNTFFQIVLCFYMWHYNRYERPPWATGLFVALACIVAGAAGIMMYHEGKYVKRVEGVPVPRGYENTRLEDLEALSNHNEPVQPVPATAAKT